MLPSRRSGSGCSISPTSTTGVVVRMLCISVVALAALCLFASAPSAHASSGGSLALGTVTGNTLMVACGGGQWLSGMTCHSATITGCPSVDNINFIYGYLPPAGTPQGIIVYFDGGDGTSAVGEATELQMLSYYASQNYGVVEIAWATAWEQTTNANIQNAACRPATFLNFIYSGIYQSIATGTGGNPNAGMCAQGYSAGSAAVAYSLAYYGAGGPVGTGGYLDAVELISGPKRHQAGMHGAQRPQRYSLPGRQQPRMPAWQRQPLDASASLCQHRCELPQGMGQRQHLPEYVSHLHEFRLERCMAGAEYRRSVKSDGARSRPKF
jgi:hypothetical protein